MKGFILLVMVLTVIPYEGNIRNLTNVHLKAFEHKIVCRHTHAQKCTILEINGKDNKRCWYRFFRLFNCISIKRKMYADCSVSSWGNMRRSRSAVQLAASLAVSAEGTNVHFDPLLKVSCSLLASSGMEAHRWSSVRMYASILLSSFLKQIRFLSFYSFSVVPFISAK